MSRAAAYVRLEGANLRQYIAKVDVNHGADVAREVAKRCVWDLVDFIGKTQGPTWAVEILDHARAAYLLDEAPPINQYLEQDNLALVAQGLEGLQTLTHQNRQCLAALTDAVGALVAQVRAERGAAEADRGA